MKSKPITLLGLLVCSLMMNCTHKPTAIELKKSREYRKKGNDKFIYAFPKDLNGAVADYDSAIALNPADTFSIQGRGLVRLFQGHNLESYSAEKIYFLDSAFSDLNQAITDFDHVIELDPKNASAYNNRGDAYYSIGATKANYQQAIADYDKSMRLRNKKLDSLENNPNETISDAILLYFISCEGHYRQNAVNEMAAIGKDNKVHTDLSDPFILMSIKRAPSASSINAQATDKNWLNMGCDEFDKKKYHEAISEFSNAIRAGQNTSLSYADRGVTKLLIDHFSHANEAIADLTQAISLDPKSDFAYFSRGNAKFIMRHYNDAIKDYNQAILIDSDNAQNYYNRGYAYYKIGRTKKNFYTAIVDFNRGLNIDSNFSALFSYKDSSISAIKKMIVK